jgi:SSS family solute:Na+ symporter
MLAKVAAKGMFDGITDAASMDSEMGLPVLATVLPVGLMGLMLSSYSAILSTADSCLMAASGNIVTDIIAKFSKRVNA